MDRGIPQEQLAYDAGIDTSYMSGLELGRAKPTIDLLELVAETLGVPLSDLLVQPDKGATVPKTLPYASVSLLGQPLATR
ncbi:transcriptional regulator with XRE-family HTH domain [Bradyrhizobium sp. USDA 4486]